LQLIINDTRRIATKGTPNWGHYWATNYR